MKDFKSFYLENFAAGKKRGKSRPGREETLEDNETAKKIGKGALKVAGKAAKGTAKLAGKSALAFADYMTDGDVSMH